jgi:hypothetical protein
MDKQTVEMINIQLAIHLMLHNETKMHLHVRPTVLFPYIRNSNLVKIYTHFLIVILVSK